MQTEIAHRLCSFIEGKRRIFLYGPGNYGSIMKTFLEKMDTHNFAGFLSTKRLMEPRCSIPPSEVNPLLTEEDGVIFSFRGEEEQQEIAKQLPCPSLLMSKEDLLKAKYFSENKENFEIVLRAEPPLTILPSKLRKRHILVVQLEITFGDMIWSTAFLRELRKWAGADATIIMVISPRMKTVMEACPYVDQFLFYESENLLAEMDDRMIDHAKAYAEKNLQGFDMVFLPRRLPEQFNLLVENVLVAIFSGAPIRLAHGGYATAPEKMMMEYWQPYFSKVVLHSKGRAESNCDCDLLRTVGVPLADEDSRMEYWRTDEAKAHADKILSRKNICKSAWKCFVAVGIVGSLSAKSYCPENYQWIFQRMPEICFLIFGGKDATNAASIAAKDCRNVFDFTGETTIPEASCIIEICDMYLGSDTGLLHLAVAYRKPCVLVSPSVSGTNDAIGYTPVRTGPWLVPKKVVRPEEDWHRCEKGCVPAKYPILTIQKEKILEALQALLKECME